MTEPTPEEAPPGLLIAPPDPGFVTGADIDAYNSWNAVRQSTLVAAMDTLAEARRSHFNEPGAVPTKAMVKGSLGHLLLLEPHLFASRYAIGPQEHRNSKVWKAWAKEQPEQLELLKPSEVAPAKATAVAVLRNPIARLLLRAKDRVTELSMVWQDDGFLGKARPDLFSRPTGEEAQAILEKVPVQERSTVAPALAALVGWEVVVDLKFSKDPSPPRGKRKGFWLQVFNGVMHAQLAWCRRGFRAMDATPRKFVWLAIRDKQPQFSVCHEPEPEIIDQGQEICEEQLARVLEALRTDHWPCHEPRIHRVYFPNWAYDALDPTADQEL